MSATFLREYFHHGAVLVVKLGYLVPWMFLKTQWYLATGITFRESDSGSPISTNSHKVDVSEVASYRSPLNKRKADLSPSSEPTVCFILGKGAI